MSCGKGRPISQYDPAQGFKLTPHGPREFKRKIVPAYHLEHLDTRPVPAVMHVQDGVALTAHGAKLLGVEWRG